MTLNDVGDGRRPDSPTLNAYRTPDGYELRVWCDHCCDWHDHTAHRGDPDCHQTRTGQLPCTCPPGSGDGHREAHCPPDSGYWTSGYILREVDLFTPEVQRAKEADA
jgi:hypothetical protein